MDWPAMLALMTVNPARLCRLDRQSTGHGLGTITIHGPADITLIDPDAEWTVTTDQLAGKSVNTPYLGRTVRSRAVAAIVGGHLAMHREDPAQMGEFLSRNAEAMNAGS